MTRGGEDEVHTVVPTGEVPAGELQPAEGAAGLGAAAPVHEAGLGGHADAKADEAVHDALDGPGTGLTAPVWTR